MTALLHLLLWALLSVAAVTTAAVLTARWAWRRTRRAVTSRLEQLAGRTRRDPARPTRVDRSHLLPASGASLAVSVTAPVRLRARAALPGPGRQVAVVRRDLRAEVTGAARAVGEGRQAGRPVEGLDSIVRRLREQARALDVDLAVIATEPDLRTRHQLLAAQDERLLLLRRACADVRRGVVLAGSATTSPLLRSMVDELDDEVLGLGLRADAYAELTGR